MTQLEGVTMTQETNSANEVTETSETQVEKTYTQKELDDMMAKTKSAISRKYEKKFEELGDIEELKRIKSEYESKKQEEQLKRGEFEKIMQEITSKKDAEIAKRDSIIREYKINTPILEAASKYKAINADQVRTLLSNNIRLNEQNEPEVVDTKGTPKYTDQGTPYTVDDLVREFLSVNSHFVAPGPATTHSKSNVAYQEQKVDITKLNMNDPKDRELYKTYRKSHNIS